MDLTDSHIKPTHPAKNTQRPGSPMAKLNWAAYLGIALFVAYLSLPFLPL